ncbi:hypothetical protein P154DRAFT_528974 [Amniculicola lignicola CBS 123094]|uniref:Uncharacterized protein n=1 Tax=Amniculicola lignicola CBS 123094 TaxID=1392246 RepID=A0A6A5X345_9PLEO|nr:hypothetical protein P154DRAFT_528974 [Amniculicola lignicola CBS 123094]
MRLDLRRGIDRTMGGARRAVSSQEKTQGALHLPHIARPWPLLRALLVAVCGPATASPPRSHYHQHSHNVTVSLAGPAHPQQSLDMSPTQGDAAGPRTAAAGLRWCWACRRVCSVNLPARRPASMDAAGQASRCKLSAALVRAQPSTPGGGDRSGFGRCSLLAARCSLLLLHSIGLSAFQSTPGCSWVLPSAPPYAGPPFATAAAAPYAILASSRVNLT